jgi:hypothetical protein
MLNQNFAPNELAKVIKKGDGRRYSLWSDINNKEADLKKYSNAIMNSDYKIIHIAKQESKGKPVFVIDSKNGGLDYLAIRKADSNLRKIYQVKQNDRSRIVKQLLSILEDGSPMHLLKLDIKSFYESIDPDILIKKFKTDQLISKKTENILQSLFNHKKIKRIKGLPRGISVSATLSEIFMRKLDREIKKINGVYFYSRFVDDIVIVCFENKDELLESIIQYFKTKSLFLNDSKQDEISLSGGIDVIIGEFNYLGYRFEIRKKKNKKTNMLFNKISVYIADSKIIKIKGRIVKIFLEYFTTKDFVLLKNRLKFLTGNCAIDKNRNGWLMVGNYYNYPLLTESSVLRNLDIFLYSLLRNKNGRVGRKIQQVFNDSQINTLLSYSFFKGYYGNGTGRPIIFNFSQSQLKKITKCWKYE